MKKTLFYFVALLGMVLPLASCGDDYEEDPNSFDLSSMTEQQILSTFVGEWNVEWKTYHKTPSKGEEKDKSTERWIIRPDGTMTVYSHDDDDDFVNEGVFTVEKSGGKVYVDAPLFFYSLSTNYELKSLTNNSFLIQAEYDDGYLVMSHHLKGKKK